MTEEPALQPEMLAFFKALSNQDRLKIIGLLATGPLTAAQIADKLSLPPYEVLRHLEQLAELELVWAEAGEHIDTPPPPLPGMPDRGREAPSIYHSNDKALPALAQRLMADQPRTKAQDFEGEDFERKVLKDFMTVDGRLKAIPSQEKKKLVILRHLVKEFQPGERYPEKQVNEILRRYHVDTAALRRYMVDNGLLMRENGIYWRP